MAAGFEVRSHSTVIGSNQPEAMFTIQVCRVGDLMDIGFCVPCDRHFQDTDGTGVCPQGHEPGEDQDDWLDYLGKATG